MDSNAWAGTPSTGDLSSLSLTCPTCKTPYSPNNVVDHNNQLGSSPTLLGTALAEVSSCSYTISCTEEKAFNFEASQRPTAATPADNPWLTAATPVDNPGLQLQTLWTILAYSCNPRGQPLPQLLS